MWCDVLSQFSLSAAFSVFFFQSAILFRVFALQFSSKGLSTYARAHTHRFSFLMFLIYNFACFSNCNYSKFLSPVFSINTYITNHIAPEFIQKMGELHHLFVGRLSRSLQERLEPLDVFNLLLQGCLDLAPVHELQNRFFALLAELLLAEV